MATGSSGRASHSGSKAFDFGSDDILCSYEDFGNQDEFNRNRATRSSTFTAAGYNTPEESSFKEGVIFTVENTVKKYTDNLMRFLEGVSSRLSQLELYCYNLDKSIGEMRSDLSRDHIESESKLKSLEKHVQEVHRSVQILRDRQELADTQKELAKLQLAQKESSSDGGIGSSTQQQNERSDAKKGNENVSSDGHDEKQLALALPHHQAAPPPPHQQPSMAPPQTMTYYLPPPVSQMTPTNITTPSQKYPPQTQPTQHNPQVLYQQQWAPTQQLQTAGVGVYGPYLPPTHQPSHSPVEMGLNNSVLMQRPTAAAPQDYSYGASSVSRPSSPMPPQHLKTTGAAFASQSGDSYFGSGNSNAYVVIEGEGGRMHPHMPHFQQQNVAYSSTPGQRMPPTTGPNNMNIVAPQPPPMPYNELIDKLVGMGYRCDHVVAIIRRLDEAGQPIDFNLVLDMLNAGGVPQRGWRP